MIDTKRNFWLQNLIIRYSKSSYMKTICYLCVLVYHKAWSVYTHIQKLAVYVPLWTVVLVPVPMHHPILKVGIITCRKIMWSRTAATPGAPPWGKNQSMWHQLIKSWATTRKDNWLASGSFMIQCSRNIGQKRSKFYLNYIHTI